MKPLNTLLAVVTSDDDEGTTIVALGTTLKSRRVLKVTAKRLAHQRGCRNKVCVFSARKETEYARIANKYSGRIVEFLM